MLTREFDTRVARVARRSAIATAILGITIWLMAAAPSSAAELTGDLAPEAATCEFFSEPQRYNTEANGDVIVIGNQLNRRYRVIVAGDDDTTLSNIRACVLDAFVTRSQIGTYIQVASFERRSDAETIERILRRAGYRTRTVYSR